MKPTTMYHIWAVSDCSCTRPEHEHIPTWRYLGHHTLSCASHQVGDEHDGCEIVASTSDKAGWEFAKLWEVGDCGWESCEQMAAPTKNKPVGDNGGPIGDNAPGKGEDTAGDNGAWDDVLGTLHVEHEEQRTEDGYLLVAAGGSQWLTEITLARAAKVIAAVQLCYEVLYPDNDPPHPGDEFVRVVRGEDCEAEQLLRDLGYPGERLEGATLYWHGTDSAGRERYFVYMGDDVVGSPWVAHEE
jgi:hypothetical protein